MTQRPPPPRHAGIAARTLAIASLIVAAAFVIGGRLRIHGAAAPEPHAGDRPGVRADPPDPDRQEPGRGRCADSPLDIPWLGWRDIVWRTYREIGEDRLTLVAGSVTYFTLLAIFPALGVFVSLYGLFADVNAVERQLNELSAIFPPEAVYLVGEQMLRLANGEAAQLSLAFVVSLLFSVWSANAGMKALFDGLNIAYDETERRSFLARTAITYLFTAVLIAFLILVSAILVAAPLALEFLGVRSGWLIGARWPLVYLVAAAAFTIAYRYGPSRRRARWRWLIPGGACAALLWMAGSAGFSWYINSIARLDVTYGSLGAVIGVMLWVWFSAMAVLMGAEFAAEIEHQTGVDTTVGPTRPMGARGAAMADTLGRRFIGLRQGAQVIWGASRRQVGSLIRRQPVSPVRPPAPPAGRPDPRRSADL